MDDARILPHLRDRAIRDQTHARILRREHARAIRDHIVPLRPGVAGGDRTRLRGIPAIGGPIPGEGPIALLMQTRPGDDLEGSDQ